MSKLWVLSLAVLLGPGLAAQQPQPAPQQAVDTAEAGRLRTQIEQRFSERVQQELKLTPDQAAKLRASQERFGALRRDVMRQQLDRRQALNDQMRPGVAANPDSVRKLMDGMRAGREQMVKIEKDEDQEMSGYLNPVQRAQYQQMRERFMQRVNEMRMERRERRENMGEGRRPGMQPRVRPGGRRRGI
jgi:hypothetical protein